MIRFLDTPKPSRVRKIDALDVSLIKLTESRSNNNKKTYFGAVSG